MLTYPWYTHWPKTMSYKQGLSQLCKNLFAHSEISIFPDFSPWSWSNQTKSETMSWENAAGWRDLHRSHSFCFSFLTVWLCLTARQQCLYATRQNHVVPLHLSEGLLVWMSPSLYCCAQYYNWKPQDNAVGYSQLQHSYIVQHFNLNNREHSQAWCSCCSNLIGKHLSGLFKVFVLCPAHCCT